MSVQKFKLFLLFGKVKSTLLKANSSLFAYRSEFICSDSICVTTFIFQLRTIASVPVSE